MFSKRVCAALGSLKHSCISNFFFFLVCQSRARKRASMTSWLTHQALRMRMRRIKRRCLSLSSLTDLCCLATTSRCLCPKGKHWCPGDTHTHTLILFSLSSWLTVISKTLRNFFLKTFLGPETGCSCPTSSGDFGCPLAASARPSPTWRW